MSPYKRAALSVIRLVAAGFIIVSLCLYAGDLLLFLSRHPFSGPFKLALKGVPFLIGLVLFWKSSDMAEYFTQDLD